MKQTL